MRHYFSQKLMPCHIAQAVRAAFVPSVAALTFGRAFWETWAEVYRGAGE